MTPSTRRELEAMSPEEFAEAALSVGHGCVVEDLMLTDDGDRHVQVIAKVGGVCRVAIRDHVAEVGGVLSHGVNVSNAENWPRVGWL